MRFDLVESINYFLKTHEIEELKPSDNHKKSGNLDDTTKSLRSNNKANQDKIKLMKINTINAEKKK